MKEQVQQWIEETRRSLADWEAVKIDAVEDMHKYHAHAEEAQGHIERLESLIASMENILEKSTH